MNISSLGLRQLKIFEGERLTAYRDSAGKLTVGIGHLVRPQDNLKSGDKITKAESLAFLLADVSEAENAVNSFVTVKLRQHQYDALVMFAYNEGADKFKGSTLLRFLNNGNYKLAADKFLNWVYQHNPKTGKAELNKGLINRRRKERSIFINGY
jgi:lysozyme